MTHPLGRLLAAFFRPIPGSLLGQIGGETLAEIVRSLFSSGAQAISPVVLDLDKDGVVETTALADGSYFDHDGNGFAEQTGWASSEDGMLVRDANGNGTIDNGKELFGSETILNNGTHAANGFQVLAELDTNVDGKVDANDSAFSQLKIWQDIDGDGYSSADEFHTLDELGIASINTAYTSSTTIDAQGNEHRQLGNFTWNDGTTNAAEDIWFQTDKMYTIAEEWVDVPSDIAALPDMQGFGNVYDLQQVMARDRLAANGEGLKGLIEQFISATDVTTRDSLMEQILFKWTGSEGIDPASRGAYVDARKVAALEKLFGQAFVRSDGQTCISQDAAALFNLSYKGVFEMIYAQLMAQTHLADLYGAITYTWDDTTQTIKGDLSAAATELLNRINTNYESGKQSLSEFVRTLNGFDAATMMNSEVIKTTINPQEEELLFICDSLGKNVINGYAGTDVITGTGEADAINGYGGNDQLYGEAGNDILYGGGGNDTIIAGLGDDTIDGGLGDDTVFAQDGNDILYGGAGNDTLNGGNTGNDLFDGGAGNDALQGGGGDDIYKFGIGSGQDVITDYDTAAGNIDTVDFGVNPLDLILSHNGSNLSIAINGTADQLTVQDWYSSAVNQTEIFKASDGSRLLNTQVEQLIQAMATFSTDNGMSWSEAIQQRPQETQAVLAQYWTPQT